MRITPITCVHRVEETSRPPRLLSLTMTFTRRPYVTMGRSVASSNGGGIKECPPDTLYLTSIQHFKPHSYFLQYHNSSYRDFGADRDRCGPTYRHRRAPPRSAFVFPRICGRSFGRKGLSTQDPINVTYAEAIIYLQPYNLLIDAATAIPSQVTAQLLLDRPSSSSVFTYDKPRGKGPPCNV